MRIVSVFAGGRDQLGGAERQFTILAEPLRDRGVESVLALVRPNGVFERAALDVGSEVVVGGNGSSLASDVRKTCRRLRDERFDLAHLYGLRVEAWGRPWFGSICGVPVVSAIRGVESHRGAVARGIGRLTSRWVRRWISNSDAGARVAIELEGARADRMAVVRNAVPSLGFVGDESPLGVRRSLGLAPEDFVVCLVGNHSPVKRHVDAIDALSRLREVGSDVRLVLVGNEGPETPRLRARIAEHDLQSRVVDLGYRNDVPRILRSVDVVLSTSSEEGTPNALLEAMRAGLPVVATRVGGVPEIVDDGVEGLLVPALDVGAIASALARARTDESWRTEAGRRARERVDRDHDIDAVTDRLVEIYRAVVEESPSRSR